MCVKGAGVDSKERVSIRLDSIRFGVPSGGATHPRTLGVVAPSGPKSESGPGRPARPGGTLGQPSGKGGTGLVPRSGSMRQCKGRNFSEPTVDFTRDSTFHEAELRRDMRPMPAKSSLSEVCVRIAGWLRKFEVI